MNIEQLTLNTAIFEGILQIYKTSLLHEIGLTNVKELEAQQPRNTKARVLQEKEIKRIQMETKKAIERAEKYNSETITSLQSRSNLLSFVDSTIDMYTDLSQLLFDALKDVSLQKPKSLSVCILEESKEGNLFHDGKQYKIWS